MDASRSFTALLVGLGRIGLLYDIDGQADLVLTHARALLRHPGFRLLGGVDPDTEKRGRFTAATGLPAFPSLPGSLPRPPDLIVLATPPQGRLGLVQECLGLAPRLLLLEKPLAVTAAEGRAVVEACRRRGVPLGVNYHRRYEPAVARMRDMLASGDLGRFLSGNVVYTGGLAHNASHFVDLLRHLLGEPEDFGVIARPGRPTAGPDDVDFFLQFDGAACLFSALPPPVRYCQAEVSLHFEAGLLRYADFGRAAAFHPAVADPHFSGCQALGQGRTLVEPDEYEQGQLHVAAHLHRVLDCGEPLLSDGDSALATLELCAALGERWTRPA